MSRQKVAIRDSYFMAFGQKSGITGTPPQYFDWTNQDDATDPNICFFTGSCILDAHKHPAQKKIAWMIEPDGNWRSGHLFDYVYNNIDIFDYVLTYIDKYVDNKKTFFLPCAGTLIREDDRKLWNKTKLCSMLVSDKRELPGHILRHEIVDFIADNNLPVDVFFGGPGHHIDKIDALRDYMFSICVMPVWVDSMWNEQQIDCFLTGTYPIYWGSPNIEKHFHSTGMLRMSTINTLKFYFEENYISERMYERSNSEMLRNFRKAHNYIHAEDIMWREYQFLFK